MADVERITTTERHAEITAAIGDASEGVLSLEDARHFANVVLPFIEEAKAEAYAAGAKALAAERVRIVATQYDERVPENLHGALMVAIQRGLAGVEGNEDDPPLVRAAEVVLPIVEHERVAERVRVVEGLVATIKALSEALAHYASEATWELDEGPGPEIDTVGHVLWWYFGDGTGRPPWEVARDVLAVVEAAREGD